MREIDAFDARLGELMGLLEHGEEIVITRHGKAVARLISLEGAVDRQAARTALSRIRERAERLRLGPFDWNEWKQFRDEGRSWVSRSV